jgi:hypothetical protein
LDPAVDGHFCNGFEAMFVGASIEDGFADAMGDRLVNEFLPLGPVDPHSEVPGCPDVKFWEFVPAEEMDDLYDDMSRYWRPGYTHAERAGMFVEIAEEDGVIKVVEPAPRFLNEVFGKAHPLVVSIDSAYTTASVDPDPDPDEVEDPPAPIVPWHEFANEIKIVAFLAKWYRPYPGYPSLECLKYARGVLRELNGPVPCSWPFVCLFSSFAHVNQDNKAEFEYLVRSAFERAVFLQERDTARPA